MAENTVTAEQLAQYLNRRGKFGAKTLSILGHYRPFVDAINSDIGKQLLRDAISIYEELLSKVGNLTATPEETMKYAAVREIIMRWSDRLAIYEKNLAEVQKG